MPSKESKDRPRYIKINASQMYDTSENVKLNKSGLPCFFYRFLGQVISVVVALHDAEHEYRHDSR